MGGSTPEVKMSLNVARERLTVFGEDSGFRRGTGAPSGGRDAVAALPSPDFCLDCFFCSFVGLGSLC